MRCPTLAFRLGKEIEYDESTGDGVRQAFFFVRFMTMDNYRISQNLSFSLLDLSFFVGVFSKTSRKSLFLT